MEAPFPDVSSSFANEGTAAHMLAEQCLANGFDPDRFKNYIVDVEAKANAIRVGGHPDNRTTFLVDDHMISNVTGFVEAVRDEADGADAIDLETHYDLRFIAPGMFGTADVTLYHPGRRELAIIDLKYGRGVIVEPKENPQLVLYALGALRRYHNHDVETVKVVIYQPRAPHPKGAWRSWSLTPDELTSRGDDIGDAAFRTTLPDAELHPGKHCEFCRAAATCPALRQLALEDAVTDFIAEPEPNPETVAKWLDVVGTVETWCKRVREFAAAEAKQGRVPPGYKLVDKKAIRRWKDDGQVEQTLRIVMELEDDQIYQPSKINSPAMVEKIVGAKTFRSLLPMVTKQSSGLVLAPDDDPRSAAVSAPADDFDNMTPSA